MADPAAEIPRRFDLKAVRESARRQLRFSAVAGIRIGSLLALGCGACAYACPSCHCFDMQDESNRKESVRYRNWDTCGLALFTLVHERWDNPRSTETARWRQRVMHKLSYMPQRFNLTACMGCGRCSRLCPNCPTLYWLKNSARAAVSRNSSLNVRTSGASSRTSSRRIAAGL